MEKSQSEWAKSIPLKEQATIIRRLLTYAKPFRRTFIVAILFAFLLSVVNILLPRVLQTLIDNHLMKQTATMQVILYFATLYLFGTVMKAIICFFNGFYIQWHRFKRTNIYE
jgi:ATP-binding cassette subfamily B protein